MKKFSTNLKYITFSLALILTCFTFTQSASADTYNYNCSDGGSITSDVSMTPRGPFISGAPNAFDATAQIYSTCSLRFVSLNVQNNTAGIPITLISSTKAFPGSQVPSVIPASTGLTSPKIAGSYFLKFTTSVQDLIISPTTTVCYDGFWQNPDPVHPLGGQVTYTASDGLQYTESGIWSGSIVPITYITGTPIIKTGAAPTSCTPSNGNLFVCGKDGAWKLGPATNSAITPTNPLPTTGTSACLDATDPINYDAAMDPNGYDFYNPDMRCWNAIPSSCSCIGTPNKFGLTTDVRC